MSFFCDEGNPGGGDFGRDEEIFGERERYACKREEACGCVDSHEMLVYSPLLFYYVILSIRVVAVYRTIDYERGRSFPEFVE